MATTWKEVTQASSEKRCELLLSGPEISKRIEENGLDRAVFSLTSLNFLEISNTCLEGIPDDIAGLVNVTRLVLRNNHLNSISKCIASLKKLKFLDLSCNQLTAVPAEINDLSDLMSLNISFNQVLDLPDLSNLKHLISINFGQNSFTTFPATICNLITLNEITGNNNNLESISPQIGALTALKTLDLSNNGITTIPGELGDCTKLKDLNLKGNPVKDKRLLKLIEQCHCKQVLEYVRSHCAKESRLSGGKTSNKQSTKDKKKRQQKRNEEADEVDQLQDQIKVLHVKDETPVVVVTSQMKDVRSCILCCIVKGIKFSDSGIFRKFITLQTKVHETICEKRTLATIATHDLKKIQAPITFDAKAPLDIKIIPLGRKKLVTALELYNQLTEEAELLRKEKKRNVYSGIHKYLYLLKDKPLYPCITDSTGQVISFPPITNSEVTKISEETTDILVEVTGNAFSDCQKAMEALLTGTLKLGIGKIEEHSQNPTETTENNNPTEDSASKGCRLLVQQIRVVDTSGQLRTVYPSRTDLKLDGIIVLRDN